MYFTKPMKNVYKMLKLDISSYEFKEAIWFTPVVF